MGRLVGEGSLVHADVVRGQGSAEVSRYFRQAALGSRPQAPSRLRRCAGGGACSLGIVPSRPYLSVECAM